MAAKPAASHLRTSSGLTPSLHPATGACPFSASYPRIGRREEASESSANSTRLGWLRYEYRPPGSEWLQMCWGSKTSMNAYGP